MFTALYGFEDMLYGVGLLGKFLFLLGKNLCVPKELFVFLQHETDDEVSFITFLLLLIGVFTLKIYRYEKIYNRNGSSSGHILHTG